MEHSLSNGMTRGGRDCPPPPCVHGGGRGHAETAKAEVCAPGARRRPGFLSPSSPRTDTLIIVLSETKMGNRLHKSRWVSFHGRDLLPDIGREREKPVRNQVSGDRDPERR